MIRYDVMMIDVAVDVDPKPSKPGADPSMDAVFFSPHKFIGGPGSSGLLVAKRSVFHVAKSKVPTCPGGGTVVYVSSHLQVRTSCELLLQMQTAEDS